MLMLQVDRGETTAKLLASCVGSNSTFVTSSSLYRLVL